jgi:ribonucleotide reductase alpha subunit
VAENIISWLWKKATESNDDVPYTEYQADGESSEDYQKRIIAMRGTYNTEEKIEKARKRGEITESEAELLKTKVENDEHSRKRTNNQLSDKSGKGLEQANIEQAYREGLISKEQYKEKLSEKRQKDWDDTGIGEWKLGDDGMMYREQKPVEEKPKRYKKEWQLGDDGMMYEVEVEY